MLTQIAIVQMLRDEFPAGAQGGKFETLAAQAVADGVAYGQSRLRERAAAEFWGNGVTTRVALTGREVRLLEPDDWPTPVALNTAGIATPTAAATYTAGAGGSLPAGTYLACYAYETPLGVTTPTAPTAVTVAASGQIARAAVTTPAGATVADYLSLAAGSGELRRVATGGSGAQIAIAAVPSATAPVAQVDYTALSALSPDVEHTEGGIAPDGSANPTVTTLTLGAAPDPGARVRIPYTRTPLIPTSGAALIGLDDDYLRLSARAHLCAALALDARSGDATDYTGFAKLYFAQLDALLASASGRRPPRVRFVAWT